MKSRLNPRGLGWRPDLPDVRDHLYGASIHHSREKAKALPHSVDLSTSPHMPPIADQGQLGSCTAFATCAAFDYLDSVSGEPFLAPSHLFQYWNSRSLEHTTAEDAGSSIRDAVKVTGTVGMCPEAMWPYDVAKFRTRPPKPCFTAAHGYVVSEYLRVDSTSLTELRTCLAAGYPIVFGATLYQSFEQPGPNKRGEIPMPKSGEQVLGGHAQLIVGYDDARQMFKVRNSWGTDWGERGHEWMPYAYMTNLNLADDFWTLRKLR